MSTPTTDRTREIARIETEIRRQQSLILGHTHELQRRISRQRVRELMQELGRLK